MVFGPGALAGNDSRCVVLELAHAEFGVVAEG